MKLIFMGSPEFSVPVLQALHESEHEVICVYTQLPRRAGRGKTLRPTPVHAAAERFGLQVRHPASLKSDEEKTAFTDLEADLAVVVAYGLILPKAILAAPRLSCMNLHASLLPRWRGAAPIQRAIMAGDTQTGVQAMMMEAGLDTGPVLLSAKTDISSEDTASSLHDRLSALGAGMVVEAVDLLGSGSAKLETQSEDGITYAHKLGAEDRQIDWSKSAQEIDWQIRGLSSQPGAYFTWQAQAGEDPLRIKTLMSRLEDGKGAPGEVLDDGLLVACGEGAVRILKLQRPGKGPMEAAAFQQGLPISKGTLLT